VARVANLVGETNDIPAYSVRRAGASLNLA